MFFFFNDTATTWIYTYCHTRSLPTLFRSPENRDCLIEIGVSAHFITCSGEIMGTSAFIPLWKPARSRAIMGFSAALFFPFGLTGPFALFLPTLRSEEHTSELQSLMRTSYAVFSLKNKNNRL